MLELDVKDILSLSDTSIFQPISIRKIRIRQSKQYYEVEWKQHNLPSTQSLEDQLANLSLIVIDDDQDELLTMEPADLFRHAYPDIVNAFETPLPKIRKPPKKIISRKKKLKQTSTSMSLDLLSMMHDETCEIEIIKNKKFNHRPTMAALSTSINIDVLSALQNSNLNIYSLKKSKSRPIKHKARSDMIIHSKIFDFSSKNFIQFIFLLAQKPVTLLNTSLSLDVLDIILREKQQLDDDVVLLSSSDNTDDDKDVLPLPLWDRIRQRTAV
jgi:hypothetical protein